MQKIKDKLLEFQVQHVDNLVRIITNNNSVADMSDTGTGKTYTAIAACSILKLRPIIICPKSVISTWKRVCKLFNINPYFVVNYETAILCKYYDDNNNRILCPYIIKNKNYNKKQNNNNNAISKYQWINIDENIIFIYDEVHRASNINTHNGNLLFASKLTQKPIIMLSATIADMPDKFRLFFWILNFIENKNINYNEYMYRIHKWLARSNNQMLAIHNMLYPNRATRMRIDALGDLFPETQITAEAYNMGKTREIEIEKQYKIISSFLDDLADKQIKDKANILVRILRAHQKIELLKVPTFVELANDYMDAKMNVVIFVNFTQTLKLLQKLLHTDSIIYGKQDGSTRENIINAFNDNKTNIVICNIKAGGVGISLHDIHGMHPRASIISPPWSSIELVQALGRVHRAGSKSKSLQRIIYTANTIEDKIADKLRTKIKNMNNLNDGGLKDLLSSVLNK